jgi:hypothetical protein
VRIVSPHDKNRREQEPACFQTPRQASSRAMDLPTQPVTLDVPQGEELSRHFSSFRHDVNGCLALVVAATELIRYNPDVLKRMANTLVEQPPKIAGKVREFIEQCERSLGMRDGASWYPPLWKHTNHQTVMPAQPVSFTPEHVKSLHNEIMHLGKELTQLGFVLSGVRALSSLDGPHAVDTLSNVSEQFTKAAIKFESLVTQFERAAQIQDTGPRRLASNTPSREVTLSPEQVALFHRRLLNFQRDMHEHLLPLLELTSLARRQPELLPPRAGEFSQASPKISAEITEFATEFERTMGIVRAGHTA